MTTLLFLKGWKWQKVLKSNRHLAGAIHELPLQIYSLTNNMAKPKSKNIFRTIYKKLYSKFGPQHWWPGDTPFEIMIGAILTQNTAWSNVEKAIDNLKRKKLLDPVRLNKISIKTLKKYIRPSGFYNIKAKRIKNFLVFLLQYNNNIKLLKVRNTGRLRLELLGINGIGRETADSILLYALGKGIFVVDSYTRRMLIRHRIIRKNADYDHIQRRFMENVPKKATFYNEYHALIVALAKRYCKKEKPLCDICPLKGL